MSRLRRGARLVFLVTAVGLGAAFLVSRWGEVQAGLRVLTVGVLLVSAAAGLLANFFSLVAWRRLLADAGSPLPLWAAARVFYVSQLGKYIPGSVWTLVAQVEMGRELDVPARRSATVSLLALVVATLAGLVVACLTLPFSAPALVGDYAWVFFSAPFLLALLHPRLVAAWSGLVFRLLRRDQEPLVLSERGVATAGVWAVLSWTTYGIHFGVLVAAVAGNQPRAWLLSLGVFALAWVAGFLFVVAPAGAGIREAVLVLGLASVFPAGIALALALVSRVVLVVADMAAAVVVLIVRRSYGASR
jgi:uncharacterized membrane protein YbhN (UPF0104 family)